MRTQRAKIFLWGIAGIGIGLRLWHINWGLPEIYEEATPFAVALKMWRTGDGQFDFNPHFFNYPALTFYLNFILQIIYYWIGHVFGTFSDIPAYLHAYSSDPTTWIIISRCVSVLCDAGTIVLVYFVGKKFVGETGGLFASLFTAVNVLLIKNAQTINVDSPLTFFSTLSILSIINVYRSGEWKWYLLSGVAIGCAVSSKYNGAFLVPVLLAAHVFRAASLPEGLRSVFDRRLIASTGISCALFILINPFIFFDMSEFNRDFGYEQSHMSAGHLGLDPNQHTFQFYFLETFPQAFGWIVIAAIVVSIVYLVIRHRKEHILLMLFPGLYLAVLVSWNMRAERYILPLIPLILLIAIIGIAALWNDVLSRKVGFAAAFHSLALQRIAILVAGMCAIIQPIAADLQYHSSLGLEDTRAITKKWIFGNIQRGAVIATLPMGIALPESLYRVFPIPFLAVNNDRVAPFYDERWYEDFDIIIGSDFDYARYLKEPVRYRRLLAYYDSLRSNCNIAFEVYPVEHQSGPRIWLYQPMLSRRHETFDQSLFTGLNTVQESVWVSRFLQNLSIMLTAKGKIEKAEQALNHKLLFETDHFNTWTMLARILFDNKKYDAALTYAREALTEHPNNAMMTGLEGSIYLQQHKLDEAESVLKRTLLLDSTIIPAYRDLATVYKTQGDVRQAREVLVKCLRRVLPESENAELVRKDIDGLEKGSTVN